MYGNHFYNETTRRYVAVFGTLFNDMKITRKDNSNQTIQEMLVPINYAPMEKIISRLEQDPNFSAPALTLPRMSFEITGMTYNPERKLTSLTRQIQTSVDPNLRDKLYTPAPYDIDFRLNIMAKYNEDGTKILEQILPFFKPDITVSVRLIDAFDLYLDIPIVLNGVSLEDTYEADYVTRRTLIWTLNFTLKGYYFGPVQQKKIIKFVENNLYDKFEDTQRDEAITVQPGLDAQGIGTTDINLTIPYDQISVDDDWKYIVQIVE